MRAREPDIQAYVDRDGIRVGYEVFGEIGPSLVFITDPIVDSRCWKAQVPYLARSHRVVTIDPRGNGRSDRPLDPGAYADDQFVGDVLSVMDAVGVEQAVLVGLCTGGWIALQTAERSPSRVAGIVHIAPGVPLLTPPFEWRTRYSFDDELDTDEGWAKENRHYWLRDWRGYVEFFFGQHLPEPHSTKQWEDAVEWALQTSPEAMLANDAAPRLKSAAEVEEVLRAVSCPVLLVHGDSDRCQPAGRGQRVAELTGGQLVTLHGAGHLTMAREPVVVNRLIRDFVVSLRLEVPPPRAWTRSVRRPKRVLYLSSPIGLGHGRRDLAIAQALHERRPEVEIDWLAQHPVTELLHRAGERIHPASELLANESAHFESECGEHDLHAFKAFRRMDEILVANFMVFHDLIESEHYDAWLVDEGWDVDYFLHENPELKKAPYFWMTDFVGWLPMPDGGTYEADLASDYNAEMIEHIDRLPWVRDHAIFVGDPADVVPDTFGSGMPAIRDWCDQHFSFTGGYITGFSPPDEEERQRTRRELGVAEDDLLCIVTVGGSGVGRGLIEAVAAAYPTITRNLPALRMFVVSGPRLDPASLRVPPGVEVVGYVHDLHRALAACDIAVVQGGLTTTMELTAAGRPFLYFPLRHHFEQNFHVTHRLDRYGAGRRMSFEDCAPDVLAAAVVEELSKKVDYLPVDPSGAGRVADLVSAVL